MSLPKEPRQKMINIMYLVLTALLALNVSKNILNAFVIVNDGLIHTNHNFDKKNEVTYFQFDKALANDRAKTKPYYDKAQLVKSWSKNLCNYIDSLKADLISITDGKTLKVADTIPLMEVDAKDNFDMPTHILIRDDAAEDGSKGKAHEMKNRLADYRHKVLALCKPSDTAGLNIGLKTPDLFSIEEDKKVNWEINTFAERPLVADIVMLTKYQNDIKNTEATVVQYLLNSVSAADFKFDELVSEVVAPSSYITLGDSFRAQLFVSAFSSTQKPKIMVGDIDTLSGKVLGHVDSVKVSSGVGRYAVKTDHEGEIKFAGVIDIKAPDGSIKAYPFHSSYLVAKPAVVISPTEMNVFYIGVDNPVEISAPGIPDEALRPSFQGPGSISGSKGKYTVRVSSGAGTTCHIGVSAKTADGGNRNFPPQEFRIKKVPDPVCYVVNQKGDIHVTKAQLSVAQTVQARLENFDFKLAYNVTYFEMLASANGLSKTLASHSDQFTPEMKTIMNSLKPGSHIIIQEVKVQSPAGSGKIQGVNITIQ